VDAVIAGRPLSHRARSDNPQTPDTQTESDTTTFVAASDWTLIKETPNDTEMPRM